MTGASNHWNWLCPPGTLIDLSDGLCGKGEHDG